MNYNIKNMFLMLILLLGLTNLSFAKEDEATNPLGCQNTGYRYKLKTLDLLPGEHGPHQTMYFLYNFRDEAVNLYQMRNEDSARSLYINHVIPPHRWAVLAANENIIRFICSIPKKKSEYGNVVDCADSIKVCQNTGVRFGLNNKGNYWIVGNNSKNEALRQVVHYGIIP
jgi:hypothetical protein